MTTPIYQVDAFASNLFAGNPAAICPLEQWLPDQTLQDVAAENNLSETAFLVGAGGRYALRWFTPVTEVDLCGHATLASAHVVCTRLEPGATHVSFESRSGPLDVVRTGDVYALDFPARPPRPCLANQGLVEALGGTPQELLAARDYLAVFETEQQVRALNPDFQRLARDVDKMVIVTAPGTNADFVSRFFAPAEGIPEDPVTGSAHCTLAPYWAQRLGKSQLHAYQVSSRGGELWCEDAGDRVRISGHAALYLEGHIYLPQRSGK